MFSKVLLPVDLSAKETWRVALPAAKRLMEDGGELHVVTVFPDMALVAPYFKEGYEAKALADLKDRLASWITENAPGAKGHVRDGRIHVEVIEAADEVGADAIVMASHRPEMADYLIGANASRVVSHATQSVFVVRG